MLTMLFTPALTGVLAAVIITAAQYIRKSSFDLQLNAPIFILAVTVFAMILQKLVIDRRPGYRSFDGLADLFVHIHSLSNADSAGRWSLRGMMSFVLSIFGGVAGPEGTATELTHALAIQTRSHSSHWFEQSRRTDVASSIAAAIAAAFHAPFAAVLLTLELGAGGRTLSAATSAVFSYLSVRLLEKGFAIEPISIASSFDQYTFGSFPDWISLVLIALSSAALGLGFIHFTRYCKSSLSDLFQAEVWMRILAGGVLLFLVVLVHKPSYLPSWSVFQEAMQGQFEISQLALFTGSLFLSGALVLAAFGTVGIFWPLVALGASFGMMLDELMFTLSWMPHSASHMSEASGLFAVAALWAVVLNAPLAGAVLCFELAENYQVILPCLISGLAIRELTRAFKFKSLILSNLETRGIPLLEGRSRTVMDAILVRDAMITDHEIVYEHDPVNELQSRFLKSRYAFLPVVNRSGNYVGLLTIDMIKQDYAAASDATLARFIEAKDLLYRAKSNIPTVRSIDALSKTAGLFEQNPCIAVLGEDGRVVGLLFAYNVRVAYDREVARRSLAMQTSYK